MIVNIHKWDELDNESQIAITEQVDKYLNSCSESNETPESSLYSPGLWCYIIKQTNNLDLADCIKEQLDYAHSQECIYGNTQETDVNFVIYKSIDNQEKMKNKITSILDLKAFW